MMVWCIIVLQLQEMIEDQVQKDFPPKETLYIRNVNEKIKSKDVKYALFNLFQSFGQVVQIICKRNDKMRGQAFVVFRQVAQATSAKNNLNGYPIFGKPMKIHFAAKRSKIMTFGQK